MSAAARPRTAVVGAGGLARAFLPGLLAAGYPVVGVAARSAASARRACRGLRGARPVARPDDAVREAALVLLAVPDREIEPLARDLARRLGGWKGRIVLHHAGALDVSPLAPLARKGASTGVLHPLQCLGRTAAGGSPLRGSRARIEGDVRAAAAARRLARDLGLSPLRLPRLSPSDRAAYHAAASLVANDLVALLALASDLLAEAGLDPRETVRALVPLGRGVLQLAEKEGLAAALTGPVARGDAAVLEAQLRRIGRSSRDGARAHRRLSRVLLRLAAERGRLAPGERRSLERLLAAGRLPAGRRGRSGI